MTHFNFFFYIFSFALSFASITSSFHFYLQHRKKVIIYYTFFLMVITLLLVEKMLECYAHVCGANNSGIMLYGALVVEKIAFCMALFYAPWFAYSLMGIEHSRFKKFLFSIIAGIYAVFAIIELILYPGHNSEIIRLYIGIPILFGSFTYYLVLGAINMGKLGSRTLNNSLKVFFILSMIIFPVSLYQYYTQQPVLPDFIERPISFIILNILTILFSFKYLNQPAYLEENRLSDYFKKRFNVTDREVEIISLATQGHSNNEIGDKLFISPRTVESHLYSIFQKCGIKSRSQLINLIMSNKK